MAEEIGALRALLSASSAQFASDMGKARESLQTNAARMSRAMDTVGKTFDNVLGKAKRFGAFALAGGSAAFAALIKKSVDTAAEMGRVAESIGVTVQSLSTLTYAASTLEIEFEDLADGLITLAEASQDFTEDTGPAVEAFKALELNVTDANGVVKDADVLFKELADKFAGLENGALKSSLAVRVLGDNGARLLPLFNKGAAGIEELETRARDLRLEINNETVKAATELKQQFGNLTAVVKGFGMQIAAEAIPALNQMVGAMVDAWKSGDKLGTVLWKAFRAPGDLARTTAEFEKWAEIQRKLESGTLAEKLEVLPYKLVDVEARKNAAQAEMLIAQFAVRKREADAQAAGERERQAKKDAETAEAQKRATTEQVAARLSGLKAEEEAEKEAETRAKAAANRAKSEAAERQRRGDDTVKQLEKEVELFSSKSRAEEVAIDIASGGLSDLSTAHQQRILNLATELDALDALKAKQDELRKAEAENEQAADRVHQANMTREEKHAEALSQLETLFFSGKLSVEDYAREVERLSDVFASDLTQAVEGWGDSAANTLTEFVTGGKASIKDFANSVIKDFIRIQLQQRLTGPLFKALGAQVGGGSIPGLAAGGSVSAGGMYEVNEKGPELLNVGNRQFLMMANQGGSVTPMSEGMSGGAGSASAPQNIRVVNVLDPAVVGNWASTPEGERVVVNVIAKNASQLKQVLS